MVTLELAKFGIDGTVDAAAYFHPRSIAHEPARYQWATRHGVSLQALAELQSHLWHARRPRSTAGSEGDVGAAVQSRRPPGGRAQVRLFRNNVGVLMDATGAAGTLWPGQQVKAGQRRVPSLPTSLAGARSSLALARWHRRRPVRKAAK